MLILFMSITLTGCTLGIKENPKASRSIFDSKQDKFFICEYHAIQTPDSLFSVNEIWMERGWRYKVLNLFQYKKEVGRHCTLALTFDSTEYSKYTIWNFSKWYLTSNDSLIKYGGIQGSRDEWVYNFEIPDCHIKDTISLTLISRDSLDNRQEIGKILLIKK